MALSCDLCNNQLGPEEEECLAPSCPGTTDGSKVTKAGPIGCWISPVEVEAAVHKTQDVTKIISQAEVVRLLLAPHGHDSCTCVLAPNLDDATQQGGEAMDLHDESEDLLAGLMGYRENLGPPSVSSLNPSEINGLLDMSNFDAGLGGGGRNPSELSQPETLPNLAKRNHGVLNMDVNLEMVPGAMSIVSTFHSSLN